MKKFVLLFLLFSLKLLAQQQPATTDSLIWLQEPKGKVKTKTEVIKTKGEELASHGFTAITQHVSLVKDIPAGQLSTITFYFNSGLINLSKGEFGVEYKDTNFRLMMYDVAANGMPGSLLTDTPLCFTVTKEHRGALDLDLSALNLQTQPQLFIGMAAIDDHTTEQVVLKVRENKTALSYTKAKGSEEWTEYTDGSDFKFNIKMRVEVRAGE